MHPNVRSLFELTRKRITRKHIEDYSPADPGYPDYVKLWRRIHKTGDVPQKSEFDLSEVIGLTGWATPDGWYPSDEADHSERFKAYRRFTSAVAVVLLMYGNDSESVRIPNYLARDLLVDTSLEDREHFDAVRGVLPVVRQILLETNYEEEYPFYSMGSLLMAYFAEDYSELPSLAKQVIEDDDVVRKKPLLKRGVWDSRLLFGLTNHGQLNKDWMMLISKLTNPVNDENLQLVIEAFANQ